MTNQEWIAPSLLSADMARLGEETAAVLAGGADLIHLDVMDNHYVPNLTVGPLVCEALRHYGITAPIDVHLMVMPVDDLIVRFAKAGATYISFHPEASLHVDRHLQHIRALGCKAALALNPATSLDLLPYVLDKLDMIVIMSVNPGWGGQSFLASSLAKIRKVREMIQERRLPIRLAVDGGVKVANIGDIAAAGADVFVAGSAIFQHPPYREVIQQMRSEIAKGRQSSPT